MTGLFLFLCILFPAFAVSFIPIYLALSKQNVISQRVLSIIFILSLAIIYANRITGSGSDDFDNYYYPLYLQFENGVVYKKFELNISAVEVVLPTVFKLLSYLPGTLTQSQILIILNIFIYTIIFKTILSEFSKTDDKYLFAMTVMLLGVVGTSTLLIKQLLAIAIFLLIMKRTSLLRFPVCLAAHLASIVPLVIQVALERFNSRVVMVTSLILSGVIFVVMDQILPLILGSEIDKLTFFQRGDIWSSSLNQLTVLVIACQLFLFFYVKEKTKFQYLLIVNAFLSISLYELPLATYRVAILNMIFLGLPLVILISHRIKYQIYKRLVCIFFTTIGSLRLILKTQSEGFGALSAEYNPVMHIWLFNI